MYRRRTNHLLALSREKEFIPTAAYGALNLSPAITITRDIPLTITKIKTKKEI